MFVCMICVLQTRAIFVTKTKTRIIALRTMSMKTIIVTICETKTVIKIKITAGKLNEYANYYKRKNENRTSGQTIQQYCANLT